jgi:AcrR family transcriptional regulator
MRAMSTQHANRAARPKPYHHGNLRESLLEAADRLLLRRGAAGMTLRDVAKAAGVSHAAPYHHFATLRDLQAAVAERAFIALAESVEAACAASDPRQRLVSICQAYVAFARRRPAHFRLMFGPLLTQRARYPGLRRAGDRAFAAVRNAARAYDPEQARLVAVIGWSLSHGLANLHIDRALESLPGPAPDPSRLAQDMVHYVFPPKRVSRRQPARR